MAKHLVGLGCCLAMLAAPVVTTAAPVGLVKSTGGDALPVVASGERSKHFEAVAKQLELGGTVFGYVDVDGDVTMFAQYLRKFVDGLVEQNPQAAMFQQNYDELFGDLGFHDVKAIGLSSVEAGGGLFRNRVFAYMPEGRHGVFAGLGGPAAPFKYLALAPADADLYFEGEGDLPAVYDALKVVATKVVGTGGVNAAEAKLKAAGNEAGISALGLIKSAKGHVAGVLRLDADQPMKIPGAKPFNVPGISLLLRFDGLGGQLKPLLEQVSKGRGPLERSEADGRIVYAVRQSLPVEGLRPVIAIEGEALLIATTREFFDKCFAPGDRLKDQPQFKSSLAAVGTEGNSLAYVSPRLFVQLRSLKDLNPEMPPEAARGINFVLGNLPKPDFPLVGIRVNRPDGVLFISSMNRSLKQDVAVFTVYNPVTIGLMSAMAIPAFNKVKAESQKKTIVNNLRQLEAAGVQYCQEKGVESATYEQLVGPDKYIHGLTPVLGEDYTTLVVKPGEPLSVTTGSGEEVSIAPR